MVILQAEIPKKSHLKSSNVVKNECGYFHFSHHKDINKTLVQKHSHEKNVRGGTNRNVEKLTTTIKHYTPAKLICSSFQKEFINPCEKYAIKASL